MHVDINNIITQILFEDSVRPTLVKAIRPKCSIKFFKENRAIPFKTPDSEFSSFSKKILNLNQKMRFLTGPFFLLSLPRIVFNFFLLIGRLFQS